MDSAERLFAVGNDTPVGTLDAEKPKEGTTARDLEADVAQDLDALREELLKLAEDEETQRTPAAIKKASEKTLRKWRVEIEKRREKKANEFFPDLLLSKCAGVLGGLDAIEDEQVLARELQRYELLKRDVMRVVASIAPYVPLLGLVSGGVTVASHVFSRKEAHAPPTH